MSVNWFTNKFRLIYVTVLLKPLLNSLSHLKHHKVISKRRDTCNVLFRLFLKSPPLLFFNRVEVVYFGASFIYPNKKFLMYKNYIHNKKNSIREHLRP